MRILMSHIILNFWLGSWVVDGTPPVRTWNMLDKILDQVLGFSIDFNWECFPGNVSKSK